MARPSRPMAEAIAVNAALKASDKSARAAAKELADQVAREAMRYYESNDSFGDALLWARMAIEPDPVTVLATCPEIDIAQIITKERLARFEARECRQLSPLDWDFETSQIVESVARTLANRYRKII